MTGSRDEIRYGSMDATFDDFAPPTGNLYPTMPSVSHSAQNNGTLMPLGSSETVDLSEPIPTQVTSPTSSPFRISVTSPVKELLHSKMPGTAHAPQLFRKLWVMQQQLMEEKQNNLLDLFTKVLTNHQVALSFWSVDYRSVCIPSD